MMLKYIFIHFPISKCCNNYAESICLHAYWFNDKQSMKFRINFATSEEDMPHKI